MGRLDFRESEAFSKRFDKLGGWMNDDLDTVMRAALVAMTMYPDKQHLVDKKHGIRVVETEAFRGIPALEIFFWKPNPHTVEALDFLEYPNNEKTSL